MLIPLSRSNVSLLSALEERLLRRLIHRMPASVTPDLLTVVGITGAILAAVFYPLTYISQHFVWLGSAGIALNWFGDSLDGTLARARLIERPKYGLFIDHTADLISQVLIGVGFGLMPYIHLSSALLLLLAYIVFVAHTFIRAIVFHRIQISYFSFGPTEVRAMLIICSILLAYVPLLSQPVLLDRLAVSDIVAVSMAVISFAGFLLQAFRDYKDLARE